MGADDTGLVEAWLTATGRMATDDERAAAIGAKRPTISGWRKAIREGKPVGSISNRFRLKMEEYLGRGSVDPDGFQAGLRLAINEMRGKLDELEARLTSDQRAAIQQQVERDRLILKRVKGEPEDLPATAADRSPPAKAGRRRPSRSG